MKSWVIAAGALAISAGAFSSGMHYTRTGKIVPSIFVEGVQPKPSYALAPYYDLRHWSEYWSRKGEIEPVIAPQAVRDIVQPCVTSPAEVENCARRRSIIIDAIDNLAKRPAGIRQIALCLSTGCDGFVPQAPANACLWWSLYIVRFPEMRGAADTRYHQDACSAARFGDQDRKLAMAGLWERAANEMLKAN